MKEIKRRRPLCAFLLSFISPGLGQVYNGEFKKAILMYVALFLLSAVLSSTGLFFGFYGMISCMLILVGFYLYIALEALVSARHLEEFSLRPYNRWYLYLALFLISNFAIQPLVGFIIKNSLLVAKPYKIASTGMEPTLLAGDHLVAHMGYYRRHKPQRGDLILFSSPNDPGKDFLKRVIALEGEKIEIIQEKIYINDQLMDDPWAHPGDGLTPKPVQQIDSYGPEVVPKSCYFVLGDNRRNSLDSRVWGSLDSAKIKGKPLYIYWSKDKKRIGLKIE